MLIDIIQGLDILPPSYFITDGAKEELQEYLASVNIQNNVNLY